MASINAIRVGIETVLKKLKKNSPYTNKVDLSNKEIYSGLTEDFKNSTESLRVAIIFGGLDNTYGTGGEVRADIYFTLMFITTKRHARDEEPEIKVSKLADDVMDAFVANDSLGGVVQGSVVEAMITDENVNAPDATLLVALKVDNRKYY